MWSLSEPKYQLRCCEQVLRYTRSVQGISLGFSSYYEHHPGKRKKILNRIQNRNFWTTITNPNLYLSSVSDTLIYLDDHMPCKQHIWISLCNGVRLMLTCKLFVGMVWRYGALNTWNQPKRTEKPRYFLVKIAIYT